MPASDQPTPAGTPVEFPHGLPGFESERRFRLLHDAGLAPLVLLQSEATAGLCFLTLPIEWIARDYELAVTESDCQTLRLDPAATNQTGPDLLGLAVVTMPEAGPATANLLAPVVVNLAARVGLQTVRSDRRYSHQHPLEEGASCS